MKSIKLICEKNSDYTGVPFIYNLLNADFVDLHTFFGRGVSLLSFAFYKLLTDVTVKESVMLFLSV